MQETFARTGRIPRDGRYLSSSPTTAVWPLWAALNSGVAPSYKRKHSRPTILLKSRFETSFLCPIILHLRVWWHRPLHQLSKAFSQHDRVPFVLLSIKAWHHRFLPYPFLLHAPGEPLKYARGHFERQWITLWLHPTKFKKVVMLLFNSKVANYTIL